MDWGDWLVPDTTDKSKIRKQLRDEDIKPATVIKKLKSTLIAKSFFLLLLKKKSCRYDNNSCTEHCC